MLHILPGLVEQSSQRQRICRAARPSTADFVNPTANAAGFWPVFLREPGDARTNSCAGNPVQTNGEFVASVSAHLWAYGPHVWGSSVPDASLCLRRLNVNSALFQLCEISATMCSPVNLIHCSSPGDT